MNPKITARIVKISALRATARSPARSAVVEGFPRSMLIALIESLWARPGLDVSNRFQRARPASACFLNLWACARREATMFLVQCIIKFS